MKKNELETVITKIDRMRSIASMAVSAMERDNAFSFVSQEDILGTFTALQSDLEDIAEIIKPLEKE